MILSSDDDLVPYSWKMYWAGRIPRAATAIAGARTFSDMRRVALIQGLWLVEEDFDQPFEDAIARLQIFYKKHRLGLAGKSLFDKVESKRLRRKLKHTSSQDLCEDLDLWDFKLTRKDTVIIGVVPKSVDDNGMNISAAMYDKGYMILTEVFL